MRTGLGKKLLLYTGGIVALLLVVTFMVLERNQAQAWEDYLFNQSLSFARLATPELLKRFRGSFPPDEPADIADMHEFLGLNRDLVQFSLVSASGRRLYLSNLFEDFSGLDLQTLDSENLSPRLAAERTTMVTHKLPSGRRLLDLIEPAFGPTGQQVVSVRYLISYDSIDARMHEARKHFIVIAIIALLNLPLAWCFSILANPPPREIFSFLRCKCSRLSTDIFHAPFLVVIYPANTSLSMKIMAHNSSLTFTNELKHCYQDYLQVIE